MSASESDETPLFIEFKCFRCGDDQKIHVDKLCNVCVSYNETMSAFRTMKPSNTSRVSDAAAKLS